MKHIQNLRSIPKHLPHDWQKAPSGWMGDFYGCSGSQGGSEAAGFQQQVQGIVDGRDHDICVGQQGAAAAFSANDTDGQISGIGHGDIIEAVADGDDAAVELPGLLGLDGAHLRGGEGQHFQRQAFALPGCRSMGVRRNDVDGQHLGQFRQPGADALNDLAVFGDGAVVIQNQVAQVQFFPARNVDCQHDDSPFMMRMHTEDAPLSPALTGGAIKTAAPGGTAAL